MKVVILGGAKCVWEDLKRAQTLFKPDQIIAVNNAGRDYEGQVDHWCTIHTELFNMWATDRAQKGFPPALNYWGGKYCDPTLTTVAKVSRTPVSRGSSARVGVSVALTFVRATHIVLCGITLSPEFEHYDKPGNWEAAKDYRYIWLQELAPYHSYIKSWNGWTNAFFGEPTEKWLASKRHPTNIEERTG